MATTATGTLYSSGGVSSPTFAPVYTPTSITNGAKSREIIPLTKRSLSTTAEKNVESNSIDNFEDEVLFKQMTATTRQLLADLLPNADTLQADDLDALQQQQQRRRKSRLALARAITLVESTAPHKRQQANLLLQYLLKPHVQQDRINSSFRVGITGAAGAGKSTMIEALGMYVLSHVPSSTNKGNSTSNSNKNKKASSSFEKRVVKDECGQEASSEENDNNNKDDDCDDDVWYPKQLAVLCIDPSSHVSGGSILGDKTRMTGLSSYSHSTSDVDRGNSKSMIIGDRAFVRPSPSGAAAATAGDSGGIAGPATNDLVSILCPASGYDWILLETVGIGQSQTIISESVDLVVLLVPPGGGDGLQAVKKGIVEVADIIAVTKADGDLKVAARKTANDYKTAAHFLSPRRKQRRRSRHEDDLLLSSDDPASSANLVATALDAPPPPVFMVSASTGEGLDKVWKTISRFRKERMESGELEQQRRHQRQYWMWTNLRHLIQERATNQSEEQKKLTRQLQKELDRGETPPRVAAARLLASLLDGNNNNSIAHGGGKA
jgi:LAO/AO transport system kinase